MLGVVNIGQQLARVHEALYLRTRMSQQMRSEAPCMNLMYLPSSVHMVAFDGEWTVPVLNVTPETGC